MHSHAHPDELLVAADVLLANKDPDGLAYLQSMQISDMYTWIKALAPYLCWVPACLHVLCNTIKPPHLVGQM